jgi:hypothetical protein
MKKERNLDSSVGFSTLKSDCNRRVKNGKAQKKIPTSGMDKESKETFLDTAVGEINEMFPVLIERELGSSFRFYSYFLL